MADVFAGIRLKRARAWDEINRLKPEFHAFNANDPYTPRVKFNPKTGEIIASVHVNASPDPMWGIRIGEVIHNLRSALDHAIWELVILTTKAPPPIPNKNQFPIFETKAGFEARGVSANLANVRKDAIDVIRSEQPFPTTDGGTGEGVKSPLWHLHELSNHDKHRTIYVTGAMLTGFKFETSPLKFAIRAIARERREAGPIQEAAVLYRGIYLHETIDRPITEWPFVDDQVKGHLSTDIAFDQRTPTVGGWLVFGTLVDIANRTDHVLRRIATEIFKFEL